eukprot:SAG11_NODE_1520_length_4755_cov_14.225515_4_plen_79_part_00
MSPVMNFHRTPSAAAATTAASRRPAPAVRATPRARSAARAGMGLLNSRLVAAHMTTLTPEEIALCGAEKVRTPPVKSV